MIGPQSNIRDFPISLLATPGGADLAAIIDKHLKQIFRENGVPAPETFLRTSETPRFQNGEGKGVIHDSIRGTDLYMVVDVGNYGCTYKMHGKDLPMSPDEHFTDLKRLLGAVKNMAQRITVIMPLLYAGRQHKMRGRESLDCALALQELTHLGVDTVVTVDAHNSHVMNAIPMHGIENLHAAYQLIRAFLERTRDEINIGPDSLVVCSPDLGGMERARYFAEHFRVPLTGFYKFRDLTRVVDGKNPILEHKFLGSNVVNRSVLVVDDMLASGGSMLDVCQELRKLGAKHVYLAVTYALFSSGFDKFDKAWEQGLFDYLFGTNASYIPKELAERPWFETANVTSFLAKFIHTFNRDGSITQLLDSTEIISQLLGNRLGERPGSPLPLPGLENGW